MLEKERVDKALDLLLKDKTNLTEVIKEGGLLKQLTKAIIVYKKRIEEQKEIFPLFIF